MEYKEAVKKVQSVKPKENYMIVKFGYDGTLILPHKDGLTFMASLNAAEQLNDEYGKPHTITEMDRSKITVTPMSYVEYERYKIAALLGITLDEVKQFALQTH